jgi:NAD kinase
MHHAEASKRSAQRAERAETGAKALSERAPQPRAVLVTRPTQYESLLARHSTHGQARFFLETRGQSIDDVFERHQRFVHALSIVQRAIPVRWRRTRVDRHELDRFLFEPDDLVIALGQDGLAANIAKYLRGQTVIGLNPDPSRYDGVLVKNPPEAASDLLAMAVEHRCTCETRTMVEARLDDGQRLLALNEIYVGHRTHQSSKYRIAFADREERQSSSGIVIATGTGSTGWARSIRRERTCSIELPQPADPVLAFFVREAFPSIASGTTITDGVIQAGRHLAITSEMDEDGVLFGDGIEEDRIAFPYGMRVELAKAEVCLNLV